MASFEQTWEWANIMASVSLKSFSFWVRLTDGGPYKRITVEATDSASAIRKLPPCAVWDFCVA